MKVLIVCLLVALSVSSIVGACIENADCNADECCAGTPIGTRVCMKYHLLGDQCHFTHRTPSCGCAQGLSCLVNRGNGYCITAE